MTKMTKTTVALIAYRTRTMARRVITATRSGDAITHTWADIRFLIERIIITTTAVG
jgi:hypothetical protein